MQLGFKPFLKPKIKSGQKLHTMRDDPKKRWVPGRKIHMCTGIRTTKYDCFNAEHSCKSVQEVEFIYCDIDVLPIVKIDGRVIGIGELILLAFNDGFDSISEFLQWFCRSKTYRLIHWTDYRYPDNVNAQLKQNDFTKFSTEI